MQNSPLKAEHNTSKRAAQPPQLAVPADDDYLQDEGFLNLLEIEKMTAQTEKDVAKYQRYTEKRYNTERFIEEMEMKKEFPQLGAALEIEREQMLKVSKDRLEDRRNQTNVLRGKDIVFELLEQSLVHEELDKIRRDLDEFAYKQRDASHLLNLPFVNPDTA